MTDTPKRKRRRPTGAQRRRRMEERKAKAELEAREASQTPNPDRPLIETPQDLATVRKLRQSQDWEIPSSALEKLAKEALEKWRDPEWKPNDRLGAARLIKDLANANTQKHKFNVQVSLNPLMMGQAPQAPQREDDTNEVDATEVKEVTQAPPPIAYIEAINDTEALETLQVLSEIDATKHIQG